jgi:patatin-like phospholipase/acyl hydrolase
MSLIEILQKKGPRKLLALDGGGIHGLISLEILARIEELLRAELGRDDRFVLADYFDYIAGTSTWAIIAAGLSIGMKVAEVRAFYTDHAQRMFRKASLFKRHLYYQRSDRWLEIARFVA